VTTLSLNVHKINEYLQETVITHEILQGANERRAYTVIRQIFSVAEINHLEWYLHGTYN